MNTNTRQILYLPFGEKGFAVFLVVILIVILASIPVAMQLVQISYQKTKVQMASTAQADNVARAGLTDAVSWFRRQQLQPVRSSVNPILYPYPDAAFFPRESTSPVLSATMDENIGLVKEYPLSEGDWLWARYEVKRQKNPSLYPFDPSAVHDVSDKRIDGGAAGSGMAWYIESAGYVFRRKNPNLPYNQAPNQVASKSRVSTEIRRVSLILPVQAAAIVNDRTGVSVQSNGRIAGGNFKGLGYYMGTSGPVIGGGGAQVTGTGASPSIYDIDTSTANGSLNSQAIFGVNESDLKLMSDFVLNSSSALPMSYPLMGIVYSGSPLTFNANRKLRGGGILFVNGSLTLDSASNTLFSGVIYVKGNATINGPALISGCVIVEGNLTISGGGDVAEIDYDSGIITTIQQQIGQYRENKSTFYVFTGAR